MAQAQIKTASGRTVTVDTGSKAYQNYQAGQKGVTSGISTPKASTPTAQSTPSTSYTSTSQNTSSSPSYSNYSSGGSSLSNGLTGTSNGGYQSVTGLNYGLDQNTLAEVQRKAQSGTALTSSNNAAVNKAYADLQKYYASQGAGKNNVVGGTTNGVTSSMGQQYVNSGNVKSLTDTGASNFSVSGYQGSTTPTFQTGAQTAQYLEALRNQEALAKQAWGTQDSGYNDIWAQRNKMSGQLIDSILRDSGGNASLAEVESILGRRLENQELENYRENFATGSDLQRTQLNNLLEQDFAARNNGEYYQYMMNYLNGDTNAPIAESMKQYISGLGDTSAFNSQMGTSLQAVQDYFARRGQGYMPEYVNNTYNPNPWGEISAFDIINNGGVQNQANYDWWLSQQMGLDQQPQQSTITPETSYNDSYAPSTPSPVIPTTPTPTTPVAPPTASEGHVYVPGVSSGVADYNENQLVTNDALTRYLQQILKGGF
jgi:hypothetical protein